MPKSNLQHARHSLAHLLARSVLEEYPEAKLTLGPAVDTGFYYDIDFGDEDFSDDELKKIQTTMRKTLSNWNTFERIEVSPEEAREFFAGNPYKLELIDDIEAASEAVSLYYSGPKDTAPTKEELLKAGSVVVGKGFVDLCRGGHVDSPAANIDAKSFELDSVAGAYWRGDENNKMLTRIYGLAFETPEDLRDFKEKREEAKKRDHRKLGKELGLFTFSELVGPGLPMLMPKGEALREALRSFVIKEKKDRGYEFVSIPHIAKRELYEQSGHMGKYDAMMPSMIDQHGDEYVIKPMNCPHHFEIYNSYPHSYRDLPLRLAENTTVYRNEKSGELHGLTRVKNLTQDDTHHFIRPDQIKSEIEMILGLMEVVYTRLGFKEYKVQISVRDPSTPEMYFGDNELWKSAEETLISSVEDWGADFVVEEGEAAFYGPKIDIMVTDALNREWQLTTLQLDFNQPKNFDMTYTGEDGKEHLVVVIHAAILGSFERFMGVLIEHFAGDFPFWLAPVQLTLLPVTDEHENYARELAQELKAASYRVDVSAADDSLGKRIRNVHKGKVPAFAVIGDDEIDSGEIEIEKRSGDEEVKVARDEIADQLADWS